jgi:hypothetical protein
MRPSGVIAMFVLTAVIGLSACAHAPSRVAPAGAERPSADSSAVLVSWRDSAAKRAIVAFVERVTKPGSPEFVSAAERIAVFDNDGTLWIEQPAYVQLVYSFEQLQAMAPAHPGWKTQEPFRAALAGDLKGYVATGETGAANLLAALTAGVTTQQFRAQIHDWLEHAQDPRFRRPYTELVYQPMLELLQYLRANGFTPYIVSGGGTEFIREYSERVYGIPPEQVIGSSPQYRYDVIDGTPTLTRLAQMHDIDEGPGKPIAIEQVIGRRPLMAFGNSDGDLQMLEWTTGGAGPRFAALIHHTDAAREYAYDRAALIGRLDHALDAAAAKGWTIVDMKDDWATVFSEDLR